MSTLQIHNLSRRAAAIKSITPRSLAMYNAKELINRNNYLIIKEYLEYLLSVKNQDKKSVERYRFWLRRVLFWAMGHPLEIAHQIKPPFAQYINALDLVTESKKKIIETTRNFFRWGKMYHSRRFARLPAYWIEDLTPPKVIKEKITDYVTIEDVNQINRLEIDSSNLTLLRDRAAANLLFLVGPRAAAFVTLPIKAVHLDEEYPYIEQKPSLGVKTKNGCSANTYLHIIPELLDNVREWDKLVRKHFPPEHPWYAPIHQSWGEQSWEILEPGNNRGTALNRRLHILEKMAGLPHKSPHKYRHGYAVWGLERCETMAEFYAMSRNIMHAHMAITAGIYAHQEEVERAKLLFRVSHNQNPMPDDELCAMLDKLDGNSRRKALLYLVDKATR
jgi:integrase